MDFERISMIMKFARMKRGLTQEEVAKRVRLSTSYITALENCIRKSPNTAKIVLQTLGVNLAVLEDQGLFECIKAESLRKTLGFKAICSAIDMHCYSVTPEIVMRVTGKTSDYITSKEFAELILNLGVERLKGVFEKVVKPLIPEFIAYPDIFSKNLNSKVLESCVVVDPFFLLLSELSIEITDYYDILVNIERKLKNIRFMPLTVIEKQKDELQKIVESMDRITFSFLK